MITPAAVPLRLSLSLLKLAGEPQLQSNCTKELHWWLASHNKKARTSKGLDRKLCNKWKDTKQHGKFRDKSNMVTFNELHVSQINPGPLPFFDVQQNFFFLLIVIRISDQ